MAIEPAAELYSQARSVREGWHRLADDASRATYVAQVRARLLLDFDTPPCPVPNTVRHSEYFPTDLYSARRDEVFVDGGAYDGDTIRRFLQIRHGEFGAIHAFEPDPQSHTRLRAWLHTLPQDVVARIHTHPVALYDTAGTISFSAEGTVSSAVSSEGTMMPTGRLDDVLGAVSPTLIKLDLEGAEPRALAGMTAVILRARPVLAVCVYHAQNHLWTLAEHIAQTCSDYRFFLRAHAEACWDTTLYAVPPERLP